MLSVDGLTAGYGKLRILEKVTVSAQAGEVTVIVGPNGSGKSTLLKAIGGVATVHEGSVRLDSRELTKLKPHEIARAGIAYLPQVDSTFAGLTVTENFRMAAYTVPRDQVDTRLRTSLEVFPRLSQYSKEKVSNLSGGERQMVAMTMALIRNPTVVMLDEPTANLAPKIATEVLSKVRSLAKELRLTVLLVEQNAKKALELGDKAFLLVSGKNAFSGAASDLLHNKELARLYLGLAADGDSGPAGL